MRHHNYYVYIMSSFSRTLYAGVTNDLERRVGEHKEGKPGSFTSRYNVTAWCTLKNLVTLTRRSSVRRRSRA
jgi:predicted GIY-YIG superfamily endonuclease